MPRFAEVRSIRFWQLFCIAALGQSVAAADTKLVASFDIATTVGCRDITTTEFADAYPGYKLIEAEFHVSVRTLEGEAADLSQIHVEINSPQQRLRIVDFQPRTLLESETIGAIEITTTKEKTRALGATAAGSASFPTLIIPNQLNPTANLGTNQRDAVVEKRSQVPPCRVTLASGTLNATHGVYFTLRRSPSFGLEGQHNFVLQMSVPQDWRGDWAELRCQAKRSQKSYFSQSEQPCGERRAIVAMFAEGDPETHRLARRLAHLQSTAGSSTSTDNSLVDELLAAPKASVEFSRLAVTYPLRWARRTEVKGERRDVEQSSETPTPADTTSLQSLEKAMLQFANYSGGRTQRADSQAKLP